MNTRLISALLFCSILITGCSDNDKSRLQATDKAAIINTANFTSGANLEIVDLLAGGALQSEEGSYDDGQSDYTVTSYGEHFYRIGRKDIDTVSKYSIQEPGQAIYTYSTIDDPNDPTSNTYEIVFESNSKAYMIRYESNAIWVVNPSAETEADFKLGEIDLSAYRRNNTVPNMAGGVIVDDKLYVIMQRLDGWTATAGESWVAVIDTATDTEIDTDTTDAPASLKGIQLDVANPQKIIYDTNSDLLFVQAIGTYSGDYIGGVETIDPTDFSNNLLIDDDASTALIADIAIINDTLGYIVTYAGWGDNTLYAFNPANGAISDSATAGISSLNIADLNTDENGWLWVSIAESADPRVEVVDTMSDNIIHTISTTYNPNKVVFAAAYQATSD